MTTPAPFPPALETAITKALANHMPTSATGLGSQPWARMRYCSCGFEAVVTLEEIQGWVSADDCLNAKLAAHQWSMAAETIAQHTATEWGTQFTHPADGRLVVHHTEMAAREAHAKVVAGYGPEAEHAVVSRLVLTWQEVKA